MRKAAAIAAALYLVPGVLLSSALAYATPATSLAGRAYLTALWPFWLAQPVFHYELPVPAWCFDFSRWDHKAPEQERI